MAPISALKLQIRCSTATMLHHALVLNGAARREHIGSGISLLGQADVSVDGFVLVFMRLRSDPFCSVPHGNKAY